METNRLPQRPPDGRAGFEWLSGREGIVVPAWWPAIKSLKFPSENIFQDPDQVDCWQRLQHTQKGSESRDQDGCWCSLPVTRNAGESPLAPHLRGGFIHALPCILIIREPVLAADSDGHC